MKKFGGFTLVELMVTIAIAAILMSVAVPSFVAFQRNAELTNVANGLFAVISNARSEALKRGQFVVILPSNGGVDWSGGYRAFVDVDRDNAFDASKGDIDLVTEGGKTDPATMSIAATGNATGYLRFNGSGYSVGFPGGFNNATFSYARTDVATPDQIRRVIVYSPGRMRVCKPISLSDPNCSAAAEP